MCLLCISMAACSAGTGAVEPPAQQENGSESEMARETNNNNPAGDSSELVTANTEFAVDLYHKIQSGEDNLFFSPLSISLALAMTYAGAEGNTARQMADVMHYTLPQEALHPAFNQLDLQLASRGEGLEGSDLDGFQLHIVNALWGQRDYAFLRGYLDTLAQNYGAGMHQVDFTADSEGARREINGWVSEQTEERIRDLIPQGVLDELTRLVLTNAVYFKAAWLQPFPEDQTAPGSFSLLEGSEITVPMMQQAADFPYAAGDGWQLVALPYSGGDLSLLILLPDSGWFSEIETGLSSAFLSDALAGLTMQNLALRMPRFETSTALDLSTALQAMGMTDAFSKAADFSGMDGTRELYISAALHKAFVSVDEAGTEAAAATAVVMSLKAAMVSPQEVSIDRPFLFLIRDNPTGTILFMGRILDPSQQ